EMFIGPYDMDAAWDPRSVGGVYRFLNRCYNLVSEAEVSSGSSEASDYNSPETQNLNSAPRPVGPSPRATGAKSATGALRNAPSRDVCVSIRHKTIKKVTEDIHRYNFNTAVAALMEYVNELYKVGATHEDLVVLAKLLKPFAPHLASEMLERLGADDEWPKWDEKYLSTDAVTVVVQINGKLRAKLEVSADVLSDEAKVMELVLADKKVQKYTEGGIKKQIYVPKAKLVNLVV
ncbi:MAG: class I tRNA ligase family protein, partial [Candidatus Saccharibacteria bacterium]|nr:class I tRNA ligase family protein [Candidatus Saccharibacteria bacterium]